MKSIPIQIVIVIAAVLLGIIFGLWRGQEPKSPSGLPAGITKVNSGTVTYTWNRYNLQVTLPSNFSYRAFPESSSIGFITPNLDTNESSHRDTPNGFNTAADDSFGITAYPNSNGITSSDVTDFRNWRKNVRGYNSDEAIETEFLNGMTFLRSIEADGIGSNGIFYYFLTPAYIFQVSSDDLTYTQMRTILGTLKLPV